jgi:RimJ/RimL family protein N-acetyltransferase
MKDDWQTTLEYQSNPTFLRYHPYWNRTEQDVRSVINMFIGWSQETPRKRFQFAIILEHNGQLIGNCGLRKQSAQVPTAELGYEIDQRYWGHGYATEAGHALLKFGFEHLGLHRIWAYCLEENAASSRVLAKLGMRYEGCQQESEWMKNRWWNTLHYAILDHEWWSSSRGGGSSGRGKPGLHGFSR